MSNKKSALFLKTKNIGDSIILNSSVNVISKNYFVDVLCFSESKPIFEMNPNVRTVFTVPRHLKGLKNFFSYIKLFLKLKACNYDLLIQYSSDWRGAFLSRILNAKDSIAKSFEKRSSFWHQSFKCTARIASFSRHAAEQDVDLLRRINLYKNAEAPPYNLNVSINIKSLIKNWLFKVKIKKPTKLISIHACSRWKFKNISNQAWIELINKLHKKKFAVVLTGSKEDFYYLNEIAYGCNPKPLIAENFSLEMTAGIFELSDLVISIDSMAIHLASAVKTPVVAIFGPSNELNWAPWRVKHRIVRLGIEDSPSFSCRPCGMDGCGGSKVSHCLTEIKASQIYKAAKELLH